MDSPSALAFLLTLLLALCSALAFLLIYLRSPWSKVGSNYRSGTNSGTTGLGVFNSNSNGNVNVNGTNGMTGLNKGFTNGVNLPNDAIHSHSHPHTHAGTLTHATIGAHAQIGTKIGPSGEDGLPPSSSRLGGVNSMTAADLALRGRKAKKMKGGRVHVTVAPNVISSPSSASSSASRSRTSSSAAQRDIPYVYPLEFLSAAPPVIVCLTTIPSRVHHIDKCLNSIKTQNYPIAQMILAIPEECRREHTKYSIPDRVRKDAIINVVRVSTDYGPSTSLITAWSAIPIGDQHSDTLIITLEDDQIYHPDTVATLVRHALQHPDSAIGFAGYSLRGRPYIQPNLAYARPREERPELGWRLSQQTLQQQLSYAAAQTQASTGAPSTALLHAAQHIDPTLLPPFDPLPDCQPNGDPYAAPLPNPNDLYETQLVDVLCAWRGMCIRKKHIDQQLWQQYVDLESESAYWASDEWISYQLAKNGIQRRVILAPFDSVLSRLRLRHGRNSSSATHIAHQQTVLEFVTSKENNVFQHNNSTNHHHRHESNSFNSQSKLQSPTHDQLIRLRQLIRPYRSNEEATRDQLSRSTNTESQSTIQITK